MKIRPFDLIFATILISLGWGLRGTIGGGSVGAMIPGTMLGLVLGHLLRLPNTSLALFTAFCSLGIGLGGQETYGQTIGLLRSWDTAAWGMLGLTVKGSVWGFSAAALIWIGTPANGLKPAEKWLAIALFTLLTLAGWQLVNHPKLMYFSDRLNKPREEVWFGQFLGPLATLIYLTTKPYRSQMLRFMASGLVAGGFGFGFGSLWLLMGSHLPAPYHQGPWWKLMEFSFGAWLGLGFTLAADYLPNQPSSQIPAQNNGNGRTSPGNFAAAFILVCAAVTANYFSSFRLNFTLLAPALLAIIFIMPEMAWHVALSFTIVGFVRDVLLDLGEAKVISLQHWQMLLLIIGTVALVEWYTRRPGFNARRGLWLITASSSGAYFARTLILQQFEGRLVPAVFVVETILVLLLTMRLSDDRTPILPAD